MNNVAHTAESLETAKWLLDINAVNFRPEEPYKLTAGWASPVCKQFTSQPNLDRSHRKRSALAKSRKRQVPWLRLDADIIRL